MKPRILLRLIVSLVVVAAFVLGATVEEASGSLHPTALWWAQSQLRLLWLVDGFALLTLLPIFGAAALQTRLANKTEELTRIRSQHETQMEDMIQHTEETEHLNIQQANSIDALEATVAALTKRLDALEASSEAHQGNMEAEMRRLAVDAFAALAGEVQNNTRQMDAVSLAMQYQRAEIKQLRQNIRATQRPQEISEVARLTPYELAALRGEDLPLLLAEGKEGTGDKEQRTEERKEEKEKRRKGEGNTEEQDSSFILHPSSLPASSTPDTQHPTPSAGFFEPTMNAQTTFVSPTTEFAIAPAVSNAPSDFGVLDTNSAVSKASLELVGEKDTVPNDGFAGIADVSPPLFASVSEMRLPALKTSSIADNFAVSNVMASETSDTSDTAVTQEEYHFLHDQTDSAMTPDTLVESRDLHQEETAIEVLSKIPQEEPREDALPQEKPQPTDPPRGLRRWFMRS